VTPPDQVSGPPEGGWESLKVDELKAELEARGLPKSGTKAELIARLEDDETAQAEVAPAEEQQAEEVVDAEAAAEPDSARAAPPRRAPRSRAGLPLAATRTAPSSCSRARSTCAPHRARRGS
jgi:SAP domain-containing ribonucleoprotein